MIVELANTISSQDRNIKSLTYQRTLFPAPAKKGKIQSLQKCKNWALTDVCHEPIEGNPGPRTLSIPRTCCPGRTMRRTRGDVICRQCYGSSKDRAVTANFALYAPTCRLPDNLSDSSQKSQQKMTDVLTCSCRLRPAAWFLMLSQTVSCFIVARRTYRGHPGHSRPMPCHLKGRILNTGRQA
jgi:hypothetical protein